MSRALTQNMITRRRNRLVVAYAAAAAALVLFVCGWSLVSSYHKAITDAEIQSANLARAFAKHAARSLSEASRIMDNMADALAVPGMIDKRNETTLHLMLKSHMVAAEQLSAAAVTDEKGDVVAISLGSSRNVNLGDRPYFLRHKANPSLDLYIGDPILGRVTHKPVVSASRRLSGTDGEFIGILVAPLLQEYFTEFYASVSLGENGIVELINEHGTVVIRNPAREGDIGTIANTWPRIRTLAPDRVETFRAEFRSDGIERIVSVATAAPYPLKIKVAMSLPHVLGPWYTQLYQLSAATGLTLFVLLALTLVLRRQDVRLAASEESGQRHLEILDKTISSMADGVIVSDTDSKVLVSNPAAEKLLGIRNGDTLSIKRGVIYDLYQADGTTLFDPDQLPIIRAIRGESTGNVDLIIHRKDVEQTRHVKINARPIIDDHGRVRGGVAVYHDVTEAIETERQLLQAQKMESVGQLTGGVAHDFNNILTIILGNLDILAESLSADSRLFPVLQVIDQAAERGAELTQRLLAFARKQPLRPGRVELNALVANMEQLLRHALGEQIEIASALEPKLWPVMADRSHLETALINLAVNARDAMPEGGKLTIETANVVLDQDYADSHSEVRPGNHVMIAITDTGSGIPEGIRDKVFEPFFTTKQLGKGTGLGLSMVYGFVKQSGGHIKVYSEVGHGTSVKIYLPRADAAEARLGEDVPLVPEIMGSETVLLVEDDPLVRDNAARQLASLGYQVIQAGDGRAGLAVLRERDDIDLLFTDVILSGGMSGRVLAEEACRLRLALKVLFTSGYTENAIVHHGRLDQGVLLLAKPYRKAELARMVRLALANAGNGLTVPA